MAFGIFLCFLGIKFIVVTQILAGVLLTSFLLIFMLFTYLKVQYSSFEFWLIIGISVLIGIIVGYLISFYKKVPVMILGGFLGFLLGTVLYQVFLKYIKSNPLVVYWVTLVSCVILLAIIGYFFYDHVMILGSGFIGAYAIIRGLSFMIGKYPDERQIMDLMDQGEWQQVQELMTWQVYVYLAAFLIIGFAGSYIQYKFFYGKDEKDGQGEKKDQSDASDKLINK